MDAIENIGAQNENFIIKEKGRNPLEDAFVVVRNSIYMGYGFIEKEINVASPEDFEAFLIPQPNTLETESIIRSYLNKNRNKIFLSQKTYQEEY